MSAAAMIDPTDLERLREIKEQIADLVDEARRMVRGTPERRRAEAYWLAHIEGALDGRGSMVTLQDTIDALATPETDD